MHKPYVSLTPAGAMSTLNREQMMLAAVQDAAVTAAQAVFAGLSAKLNPEEEFELLPAAPKTEVVKGKAEVPVTKNETFAKIELPEGIPDVETWGKTIICWGKKQRGRAYADLVVGDATDPKYCKWIMTHATTPEHDDLVNYLTVVEHGGKKTGHITKFNIPGSTTKRVLKEA